MCPRPTVTSVCVLQFRRSITKAKLPLPQDCLLGTTQSGRALKSHRFKVVLSFLKHFFPRQLHLHPLQGWELHNLIGKRWSPHNPGELSTTLIGKRWYASKRKKGSGGEGQNRFAQTDTQVSSSVACVRLSHTHIRSLLQSSLNSIAYFRHLCRLV